MHKSAITSFILAMCLSIPLFTWGSTHYIAANGSDSNNGTSKTTPWLHAPGMPSCSNACGAYTPVAGDQFIFRGGDTWHTGNSAATPYTGGTWQFTWSGSSSSFIYLGVDQTWFSGASWTRPILTGDNSLSTSPVTSCHYQSGASNIFIWLYPVRYVTFDNFEMTGFCWSSTSLSNDIVAYGGAVSGYQNPANIQNLYIHGWTHTAAGTQAGGTAMSGYNQNFGYTLQFNVVDGSDSDSNSLNVLGQGTDAFIIQYNVFRYVSGTNVPNTCHILHDNIFEHFVNVTDNSTHTDVFMCYGEAGVWNFPGDGTPNLFYNNIFRNVGVVSSVFWEFPPLGYTDYVFNNVFHDIGGGSNYNNFCEGGGCGNANIFNNTAEAGTSGGAPGGCIICNGQASGSVIQSVNNHWITNDGASPSAVFQSTTTVTETAAVYQTLAAANGQGYNSANDFSPTSASNATVKASGINQVSAFCSKLQNATAQAFCVQGTTAGCSYVTSNHGVSCPNIMPATRPSSGAWQVGAYQYSGGSNAMLPPTNVTAQAY